MEFDVDDIRVPDADDLNILEKNRIPLEESLSVQECRKRSHVYC